MRQLITQMNGSALKIFRGALIILIAAAAIGAWNLNADIAGLSMFVRTTATEQKIFNTRIDERVHWLERGKGSVRNYYD